MTDPTCDTCKHFSPHAWKQGGTCQISLPPHLEWLTRDSGHESVRCTDSCSFHAPIPETDRTSD